MNECTTVYIGTIICEYERKSVSDERQITVPVQRHSTHYHHFPLKTALTGFAGPVPRFGMRNIVHRSWSTGCDAM
jgi:hypothetical protein